MNEYEKIPRSKTFPDTCKGCGLCCGPMLLVPITNNDMKEIFKIIQIYKTRGITFKKIDEQWWMVSPKCSYLTDDRLCSIEEHKPHICKTSKAGEDTCLLMIKLNENGL